MSVLSDKPFLTNSDQNFSFLEAIGRTEFPGLLNMDAQQISETIERYENVLNHCDPSAIEYYTRVIERMHNLLNLIKDLQFWDINELKSLQRILEGNHLEHTNDPDRIKLLTNFIDKVKQLILAKEYTES